MKSSAAINADRPSFPESAPTPAAVRALKGHRHGGGISAAAAASNRSRTAEGGGEPRRHQTSGRAGCLPAAAARPGHFQTARQSVPCSADKRNYHAYTGVKVFTAPLNKAATIGQAVDISVTFPHSCRLGVQTVAENAMPVPGCGRLPAVELPGNPS